MNSLGITHLIRQPQSSSDFYLFEFVFTAESGNSLHRHSYEDEVVYVLDGVIRIRLPDETLELATGETARLPRGIPHALHNPLPTTSRYLGMALPGGMEYFFDELDAAETAGTLDDATHRAISLKYGIEWLE